MNRPHPDPTQCSPCHSVTPCPTFRGGRGFTLVEVMVVLVLMALVTGTAALAMGGRLKRADQNQALAALQALDARARQEARATPRTVTINVDADRRTVSVVAEAGRGGSALDGFTLPVGATIEAAWLLHRGERLERDPLTIDFRRDGGSSTYGLTLAGGGTDGETERLWVLFAGGSGQMTVFDDEDDLLDILSALTRHDAD